MRRPLALAAVVSCVVLAAACRSATQIEVRITTDVPCATVADRHTSLFSGDPAIEAPYASTGDCTASSPLHDIGTIVLAPSEGSDVPLDVSFVVGVDAQSEACVKEGYKGCIRARRRVRFVPHEGLRMPIELSLACLDKQCDPEQTCFRGACVGLDFVAEKGCLGPECTAVPLTDASTPDAGVPDADLPDTSPSDGATDATIADAASDEPELLVTTTAMPRGLTFQGNEVWWSEPLSGQNQSTIRAANMSSRTQRAPHASLPYDVFGIARSSVGLAFVAFPAGGAVLDDANNFTYYAGNGGPDYVGAGFLSSGEAVFGGATELRTSGATVETNAKLPVRYLEVEGAIVSYATNGGIGFWNTVGPNPAAIIIEDGSRMMRGHAIAPNHWLVSTELLSDIYAVAKTGGVNRVSTGKFVQIEDLAWHEPTKMLYVAGATAAGGPGIYRLPEREPLFPK